jgi:hypothetical protein
LFGNDQDGAAFEVGESGNDRGIIAEVAVAVNLLEILKDAADVIERVRAFGVTGKLDAAPSGVCGGRSHGIEVFRGIHSLYLNSVTS